MPEDFTAVPAAELAALRDRSASARIMALTGLAIAVALTLLLVTSRG